MASEFGVNARGTCFSIVRFGNVLNSSGSVIPLFREQIISGGPLTLTDLRVTRYFMTISEAVQLVIQSCVMATGGDVFVLDMGEPIRILDLATKMIHLSGRSLRNELNPFGDIEISVVGLRPGEKLYEELLIAGDPHPTSHPKIMKTHENFVPLNILGAQLDRLRLAIREDNLDLALDVLKALVPEYQPNVFN
jgi:FlaA1/EpsC-like NDP-sugar epimerase